MASTVKVNTERLGKISLKQYNKLVKEAGSKRKLADSLGIPDSTVRNWNLSLRRVNQ